MSGGSDTFTSYGRPRLGPAKTAVVRQQMSRRSSKQPTPHPMTRPLRFLGAATRPWAGGRHDGGLEGARAKARRRRRGCDLGWYGLRGRPALAAERVSFGQRLTAAWALHGLLPSRRMPAASPRHATCHLARPNVEAERPPVKPEVPGGRRRGSARRCGRSSRTLPAMGAAAVLGGEVATDGKG